MMCRLVRSTEGIIRLWLPTGMVGGWWLWQEQTHIKIVSFASMAGSVFYWLCLQILLPKRPLVPSKLKLNFAL